MVWHLPPLNALRAFEAAARHQSFTLAAEELHVTPGAISRQIRTLEAALGVPLFVRNNRDVRLTRESEAYRDILSEAFRRINAGTDSLLNTRRDGPLRIVCSMVFAMRWLFPRLPRFHARYPYRHIAVATSLSTIPFQFDTEAADAIIRLGTDEWPSNIVNHRLFGSELVAICSPKLLESGPPLNTPDDLRNHTLLYSALRPHSWPRWLRSAGVTNFDFDKAAVRLESSALTYPAAMEGLGVALGERALLGDDVVKGRLITPLNFCHKNPESFHLIYPRETENVQRLKEFRAWVLQEASDSRSEIEAPEKAGELSYRPPESNRQ
ncbi:LysR substrate-binding domain-containing protein [Chelatococcus sp. GCM10030263]|uniref:LysR substrate-binding domain-containing protein n=1 Tax=Chelatococcus sp. GCM10030263 TaxID=3273387 RepID=UPI00361E16E5